MLSGGETEAASTQGKVTAVDYVQKPAKARRFFSITQVFDLRFFDFHVCLDRDGSFQLQVTVDHPCDNLGQGFSSRCSTKETVEKNKLRQWWGRWETDVMYHTKFCSAVKENDFPHTGWVETDHGMAAKTVSIICQGEGIYAKCEVPMAALISGPIHHAFYLYDGDTIVGRIYYKAFANHKGTAGEGLSINLERFTVLSSTFPETWPTRGEVSWRECSMKTATKTFTEGDKRELSNQHETIYQKGESLYHLLQCPFEIKIKTGCEGDQTTLIGEVLLGDHIKNRAALYGNKRPNPTGNSILEIKGESLVGFSVIVSDGNHQAACYVQFDVSQPPKFAQMSKGVLTADPITKKPMVHKRAFASEECDVPGMVETPSFAVKFYHDGSAGNPTPLVWGLPLPSLRDNKPIPIVRDDDVQLAVQLKNSSSTSATYFCRDFGEYQLPQNWSASVSHYLRDGDDADASVSYTIFTDHDPVPEGFAPRRATTQKPPFLPDRWCARLDEDAKMSFHREGFPQEAQAYPPICMKGFTAAPLPPNWSSDVVREGLHAGRVYYLYMNDDFNLVTSWVPPELPTVQKARAIDAPWIAFAKAHMHDPEGSHAHPEAEVPDDQQMHTRTIPRFDRNTPKPDPSLRRPSSPKSPSSPYGTREVDITKSDKERKAFGLGVKRQHAKLKHYPQEPKPAVYGDDAV